MGRRAAGGVSNLGWRRRGPWVTRFDRDGRSYGGEVSFAGDARIEAFWRAFPDARRVLELGALEGGHTVELARRAEHVTAVEGRRENVERARFATRTLGVRNVRVVHADVEVVGPGAFGSHDAVLCSALLYHLVRPLAVVDRLRDAAPGAFIWTHVDTDGGSWRVEDYLDDPTVGLNPRAFWPTLDAVVEHLRANGFPHVEVTEEAHPAAPAATIVARA